MLEKIVSTRKISEHKLHTKKNFSIKHFSKCDQIRSFLWIWSPLLKKFLCSYTWNSKIFVESSEGNIFIQEYNDVMAINGSDFNENRFQVQLETLQEYCTNLDGNIWIRSITDTLQNLKVQSHLSEVFKLTKLILVLPATSVISKRIFILLQLIKNYLRPTM